MIRERDIDDFLVCVLVVRGGSVCVINFFFDKLILFINDVDKMNMFYVVKCLEKVEIIQFIEKILRIILREIYLDEIVVSGCEVNIEMEII